jgi:hypothetical protein
MITAKFDFLAIIVFEWNGSETGSQATNRNRVLPDEVGLTEHVDVVNDESRKILFNDV